VHTLGLARGIRSDREDAGGRVRGCDDRDVLRAGRQDIGGVPAPAGHEAQVLFRAPMLSYVTKIRFHFKVQ
jgi:hypothetical protein